MLVLGLGDTGLSMARWLARHGARVTVADTRAEPPHARTFARERPEISIATGALAADVFRGIDMIAVSPGIDRREAHIADAVRRGVPVVGDVELFAPALRELADAQDAQRPKVLAITGSNGKSTVTAMTGEACTAAGKRTLVAGNIGVPVLDALTEIETGAVLPEIVALELSSFQLESTSSLDADAATVLNVTEDHLDRYDSMAAYAAAKARIFQGDGVQVLNRQDAWSPGMALTGRDPITFGTDAPPGERHWGISGGALAHGRDRLLGMDALPAAGLHNAANALAALALGSAVGVDSRAMVEGLRRFRGLPHRLQKVGEIGGVAFYDDSKGTNVGATVAALGGMTVPVVLIAGGDGKNQNFAPLAAPIAARARAVVLIGRDAPAIERVLAGSPVPRLHASTMDEAVETAYRAARPGDAVLLSPACASYDMFKSYVHRGQVFVEAVNALAQRSGGSRGE